MKKVLFAFVLLLAVCLCIPALAQTLTFQDLYASCDIDDGDYILLTPSNLSGHPEWLAKRGVEAEELLKDWEARGVLVQAWNKDGDECLEITALQDDMAKQYFDLDQQTAKVRTSYKNQHLKGAQFKKEGYTYQAAEWKNADGRGRFLNLKYKRTVDGKTVRGYARRTIRNGYTITLDYQVHEGALKNNHKKAVNKVLETWSFSKVLDKPADIAAKVVFEQTPPTETSTGKFEVEGTCEAGMKATGVLMRMSSPEPILLEATANKNGKFSMDVKLPQEGVWLMAMTIENQGVVTEQIVFDATTYQKTLLPVNFDEVLPLNCDSEEMTSLPSDQLVISGVTSRNVKVQCIVNDFYAKTITTNASGKFSFKGDVSEEKDYSVVVVFQKKNYSTRRFTAAANRTLTQADLNNRIREDAVKPAYSTLKDKLKGYTGRYMVYTLHVDTVEKIGDQWVMRMGMRTTKKNGYRDIVYVICDADPGVASGDKKKVFLECTGPYVAADEKTYPGFRFLFWD